MAMAQREHGETIVAGPGHDGGFTVTWALAVLRRHARLATVVFSVVLAGAATSAMSLPDIYRSTATVLVEHPGTTEGVGKSLIAGELETRLQTIGQEVLSQARLTALMDRFDLYPELRAHGAHAAAVERLRRDIQVKLTKAEPGAGRPTTVAFSIMFRWRHPETVARVANALAAFYVEENGKIRERQASAARLTRLTQELAQMQEVYTSQYPDVIRLKAEIAALRKPRSEPGRAEALRIRPARDRSRPRRGGGGGAPRRSVRRIVPHARGAPGVHERARPGEHSPHRRRPPEPAAALADCGADRSRPGAGGARLLPSRERQRPAGLSLLANHAVSGRQIPRSARNLA